MTEHNARNMLHQLFQHLNCTNLARQKKLVHYFSIEAKLPLDIQLELKTYIRKKRMLAALDTSPTKNQAPVIAWKDMCNLAQSLWHIAPKLRKGSLYHRRQASTMIYLTAFSGARWIDVARLQWQDVHVIHKPHRSFVQIYIRISKTNIEGDNHHPQWH